MQDIGKISIIIPVYNIKKYVTRCITSIINQTYKKIEVIAVDDGSSDGCGEILDRLAKMDERIRVVHKKNGGLSSARNAGLKLVTGDFVMYVDGDDYLDNKCLEILSDYIGEDVDIIFFPYIREGLKTSKKTKIMINSKEEYDNEQVRKILLRMLIGPQGGQLKYSPMNMDRLNTAWGKLYRYSTIEGIKFVDTKLIGPEDLWYNIQVFNQIKGKAIYTERVFYHYEKENDTSLLHKVDLDYLSKRNYLYREIENFLSENALENYRVNLYNRIMGEYIQYLIKIIILNMKYTIRRDALKKMKWSDYYQSIYEMCDLTNMEKKWRFILVLSKKNILQNFSFAIHIISILYNKMR